MTHGFTCVWFVQIYCVRLLRMQRYHVWWRNLPGRWFYWLEQTLYETAFVYSTDSKRLGKRRQILTSLAFHMRQIKSIELYPDVMSLLSSHDSVTWKALQGELTADVTTSAGYFWKCENICVIDVFVSHNSHRQHEPSLLSKQHFVCLSSCTVISYVQLRFLLVWCCFAKLKGVWLISVGKWVTEAVRKKRTYR